MKYASNKEFAEFAAAYGHEVTDVKVIGKPKTELHYRQFTMNGKQHTIQMDTSPPEVYQKLRRISKLLHGATEANNGEFNGKFGVFFQGERDTDKCKDLNIYLFNSSEEAKGFAVNVMVDLGVVPEPDWSDFESVEEAYQQGIDNIGFSFTYCHVYPVIEGVH